jgi:hypothetical protein
MLGAILSAVGLGGLGLAMVFIPGVRGAVFAGMRFIADLIRENPWQAALAAALAFSGWLWMGWGDEREAKQIAQKGWATERLGREADRKSYYGAQAEAQRKQNAQDKTELAEKAEFAERYNELSRTTDLKTRAAVDAYARAHPVRVRRIEVAAPAGGETGRAGSAGVSGDPGQPADEEAAADMVAITREDLGALSDSAVQGAIQTEYLNDLIDKGWGVRLSDIKPEFGGPN